MPLGGTSYLQKNLPQNVGCSGDPSLSIKLTYSFTAHCYLVHVGHIFCGIKQNTTCWTVYPKCHEKSTTKSLYFLIHITYTAIQNKNNTDKMTIIEM